MLSRRILRFENKMAKFAAVITLVIVVIGIGVAFVAMLEMLGKYPTYCRSIPRDNDTNLELDVSAIALRELTLDNINQLRLLKAIDLDSRVLGGDFIAFSSSGQYLGMTLKDPDLSPRTIIWDVLKPSFCYVMMSENSFIEFSSNGNFLLTRGTYPSISGEHSQLWELAPARHLASFDFAEFVEFPEGDRLSFRNMDESDRRFWNLQMNSEWVPEVPLPMRNARLFSFDHEFYITVSPESDSSISIWNTGSGSREIDLYENRVYDPRARPLDFLLSRDGNWLAAEQSVPVISVWNILTGERRVFDARFASREFAFTSDSQLFLYGRTIWNLVNNEEVDLGANMFEGLNKDETMLVTTSHGRIGFVDIENGDLLSDLIFDESGVEDVVFSPDGKLVAIALTEPRGSYSYGTIELWGVPEADSSS